MYLPPCFRARSTRYGHRVLHDLSVVRLDRDILVIVRRRRPVEEDDRDVCGVRSADRGNGCVVVGRDEDNPVDLAFDHRLDLIVLLVLVAVGDRLERRPTVLLRLGLENRVAGDPEVGVEGVEHEGDRFASLGCAGGPWHRARSGSRQYAR